MGNFENCLFNIVQIGIPRFVVLLENNKNDISTNGTLIIKFVIASFIYILYLQLNVENTKPRLCLFKH